MGIFSKLFNNDVKDTVSETSIDFSKETFRMTVENVFTVIGKGIMVTGKIVSGEVHVGDTVIINGTKKTALVSGIEMLRSQLNYAKAGDECSIALENISRDDINSEDYLTK